MHAAFLQAILERPDDDSVRLIYADWLDENGQPERADFIRTQIELAQLDENDPRWPDLKTREEDLLVDHGDAWVADLPDWAQSLWSIHQDPLTTVRTMVLRRGFVAEATIRARVFAEHGLELLDRTPLESLTVDVGDDLSALANCRWLSRLSRLRVRLQAGQALAEVIDTPHLPGLLEFDIGAKSPAEVNLLAAHRLAPRVIALQAVGNGIDDDAIDRLAGADWDRLERLHLSVNNFSDRGLEALAGSSNFPRLQEVYFHSNQFTPHGFRAWARSPHFRNLRGLGWTSFGDAEMRELARGANWPALDNLFLFHSPLTNQGVRDLIQAPWMPQLRLLWLYECQFDDAAVAMLVQAPECGNLCQLSLAHSEVLTDASLGAVARSPHLKNLRDLKLPKNIGQRGIRELADSGKLRKIHTLALANTDNGDKAISALAERPAQALHSLDAHRSSLSAVGVRALAEASWLGQLRFLALGQNQISAKGIQALTGSGRLSNLRRLQLRENPMGDAGAAALAKASSLARLWNLDLQTCNIGDAGATALAKSTFLGRLRHINLTGNSISEKGLAALRKRFGRGVLAEPENQADESA